VTSVEGRNAVSDPTYPGRVRPSTVTVSSYLLYLVAAIQVISFLVNLSVLGTFQRVYRDAFAGTNQPAVGETVATVTLIGGSALSLLLGLVIAALAMMNNRGRNGSRITTWVLGGIFLCCTGFGLVGALAGNSMNFGSANNGNGPDPAEVQRRLEAGLPGWYNPVSTVLGVVSLLALLGALILLALPASNEFFRKPAPGVEPGLPGGTYGDPSYPAYPNYPAYPPGEPPLPPPPGTPPPPGPPPPGPSGPPTDR
jgi:hypothetical protein